MSETTLLVLGSISGEYDVTLHVREDLVGVEGSFADHVDAAVYAGVLEPTPDRLPLTVDEECERLEALLGGITREVPVVAVPGHHNESVARRSGRVASYAPATAEDDAYAEGFDELTYVSLDDTATAAGVEFARTPALLDDGVLVTHEFHPEYFENFDSLPGRAYVSGSGLFGQHRGDCLNALYASHDLGPGADDALGAYYLMTVDENGVQGVDFRPLGRVSAGRCGTHADRGRQYATGDLRCRYCRNDEAYFEESLRAAAFNAWHAGDSTRLSDLVGRVAEARDLDDGQRDALRAYAIDRGSATHLFGDAVRPRTGLADSRDPPDVVTDQYLYASRELRLDDGQQAAYFDVHDVTRKRETAPSDLPDAETDGQRALDESAFHELPVGEWQVFPRPGDVTDVWNTVLDAVADRTYYDARVATEWTRTARGNDSHGVMVAVPNYFDREDIGRVYRLIEQVDGVDRETMLFKPLLYSMYGIDASNASEFDLPGSTRYDRSEFE